ncbi:MAG: hypothetical protein M4579_005718 [Chaenotheca gracillima]|nr:MAG: hypothetical protein M4579_005718 [Chaenotheca gracillima]
MQQTGRCRYGESCVYSHETGSNFYGERSSKKARERPEPTFEQQLVKDEYNSWKRLLKTLPRPNDVTTIGSVWNGALEILNGEDRDCKQMVPRDLDNEDYLGRQHIRALLSLEVGDRTFVSLACPFLTTITHPALLDCLSVDTSVGGLYNYICGANGSRAVPFFQRLVTALSQTFLEPGLPSSMAILEKTIIAMSTTLRELLRRERRTAFHDDLPDLVNTIENLTEAAGVNPDTLAFQIVRNIIIELRGMISRANGLLDHGDDPSTNDEYTSVATSTYPRELNLPQDRHDNDKMDITKIKILPTEAEIRSNNAPFLPSTDLNQPHFLKDAAERHLDTHFRLYRHDCFGEVSEALGVAMIAVEKDQNVLADPRFSLGDVRAHTYPKAHVRYVSIDNRRGLEAQISFLQPPQTRKKSAADRRIWWEESKRLDEGVLLCLLSFDGSKASLLLLTVSKKSVEIKDDAGLSSDIHQATITAKLATRLQPDLEDLVQLSCQKTQCLLVEFPGVLLATFVPILENIQSMQELSRLPFRLWILPDRVHTYEEVSMPLDVPPPLYARKTDFTFSLKPILKESEDDFHLGPRVSVDSKADIDILEARTNLDRGQCQALVAALTREFAFIQGPPGTGKSYLGVQLMQVLQASRERADLGPVVVVCYTNHALDQFLEHLLDVGIERVIRIGGQSRSEKLEGKNLRVVSKGESKTKSEGYQLALIYKELERKAKQVRRHLDSLHRLSKKPDWENIKHYLARKHPLVSSQFSETDDEGFTRVGELPFHSWIRGERSVSTDRLETTIEQVLASARRDVFAVTLRDRQRLVEFWTKENFKEAADNLYEFVQEINNQHQQLTQIHDDVDRRVLQTADVIGVTTTGLARRIATLQRVRCKVVICEEAGEVLEPHMISALLPSVEHLIQIGDHQQLRPQINNFKQLSLESEQGRSYQLDRSQFERLSIGEKGRPPFPVAQLNVQRRMRPQISSLIRETIYPRLLDHDNTTKLPDVVGMRKNVFWLDHDNFEEGAQSEVHHKSHSNDWEVEMVHALVRHVVRQGVYSSTDIAVLTPYTGQLQKLRAKMRNDFEVVLSERDQETLIKEGFSLKDNKAESNQTNLSAASGTKPIEKKKMSELLRCATIDNFQGEEAKVVIISLVRSNKQKKIGFLKTNNRINVLLSRAQHGLYLIGNISTYSTQPMWRQIFAMLQGTESVGRTFGLCCPRHTETEIQVSQPDDFARFSPEGGYVQYLANHFSNADIFALELVAGAIQRI